MLQRIENVIVSKNGQSALNRYVNQYCKIRHKNVDTTFHDNFIMDCRRCIRGGRELAYVTRKEDIETLRQYFPNLVVKEVEEGIYALHKGKEKKS
jgi:hypothetical protein